VINRQHVECGRRSAVPRKGRPGLFGGEFFVRPERRGALGRARQDPGEARRYPGLTLLIDQMRPQDDAAGREDGVLGDGPRAGRGNEPGLRTSFSGRLPRKVPRP
jgi:hypothetical protein